MTSVLLADTRETSIVQMVLVVTRPIAPVRDIELPSSNLAETQILSRYIP
ncbi:MAG: hypothetical protein WBL46_10285 [Nitrososphaeraceae archaeon]